MAPNDAQVNYYLSWEISFSQLHNDILWLLVDISKYLDLGLLVYMNRGSFPKDRLDKYSNLTTALHKTGFSYICNEVTMYIFANNEELHLLEVYILSINRHNKIFH